LRQAHRGCGTHDPASHDNYVEWQELTNRGLLNWIPSRGISKPIPPSTQPRSSSDFGDTIKVNRPPTLTCGPASP
jgi:hypothetical protein